MKKITYQGARKKTKYVNGVLYPAEARKRETENGRWIQRDPAPEKHTGFPTHIQE